MENQPNYEYYMKFGISKHTVDVADRHIHSLKEVYEKQDRIREYNFLKVLDVMQSCHLSETHFGWETGYGIGDMGREKTEEIYAKLFKAEDALVRTQIVSGTHALTIGLRGILHRGDRLLIISSMPYDTIIPTLGLQEEDDTSLLSMGVEIDIIDLLENATFDEEKILESLDERPTVVYVQRSSGYSQRPAITIAKMEDIFSKIKSGYPHVRIMVDNCYGEFVETREPIEVGADLIAGSLIKNIGGSLALSGGYVAGRADIVERCSKILITPGLKKECGLSFGQTRSFLQGLFLAPQVVNAALYGSVLAASMFSELGYGVTPGSDEMRSDIVQVIELGSKEKISKFCKAIQSAAPIDSFVVPEFSPMAGYDNDIIMAAGAFVQGASIELSADAPVREPYSVYYQGGITKDHAKLGVMKAYESVLE